MSARTFFDHRFSFKRFAILTAIPALLLVTGCGEKRVPVFAVSGKVTFDGQAPAGAQIVLHPLSPTEAEGVAPTGKVKDDGSFSISAYEQGDGAPPGEYVATIQWFKIVPADGGPGPNVIPKEYASAKTSPIKVTVNEGPTTLEPIAISSVAKKSARPGPKRG